MGFRGLGWRGHGREKWRRSRVRPGVRRRQKCTAVKLRIQVSCRVGPEGEPADFARAMDFVEALSPWHLFTLYSVRNTVVVFFGTPKEPISRLTSCGSALDAFWLDW